MAQLARILGQIWLSMLTLFVVIFGLIIVMTEGFGALWAVFNPLNLRDWELVSILALPGVGLLVIAKVLRR